MKNLNFFVLTIKHSKGTVKVGTKAEDEKAAREQVCEFEGVPDYMITEVKRRKLAVA